MNSAFDDQEFYARALAAEQEDLANGVVFPAHGAIEPHAATTWAPIPLEGILAGDYVLPTPTMLARTDGRCLLYEGKSHVLQAEPESLKSWLALGLAAEQIAAGNCVLFIDYEDTSSTAVARLRALSVPVDQIQAKFIYIRPDEPLGPAAIVDLEAAMQAAPILAVIDGVTEAFAQQGLSSLDNGDVAIWLDLLPRRLTRAGIAVLQLDHVTKDKEQRGRFAIGAQHKLAGVDVAYSMHVVEPFGRGRDGVVTIKVQKDRPGGIREYAEGDDAATMRATSHEDGRVSISLEPPSGQSERHDDFRPTTLMERVSRFVEGSPGASTADIESNVHGKARYVRDAIQHLVSEGHLSREKDGAAIRHHILTPFTTDPNTTNSSPRPDSSQLVPDETSKNSSPRPPLDKGRGRGRGREPQNSQTDQQLVP